MARIRNRNASDKARAEKLEMPGNSRRGTALARFPVYCGADEVGRGSLFGAVVAGAVILSPDAPIRGLNDSKQIEPETPRSFCRTHSRTRAGLGRRSR